jgi:imidazolonepropionase
MIFMDLIIKNIKQIATPVGKNLKKGANMKNILVTNKVDILIENSIIKNINQEIKTPENFNGDIIYADDLVATPGIIDPHTHIPFFGFRQDEYFLRQQGASYMEIMNAGGGIVNTTRAVRNASFDEMLKLNLKFADEMFRKGVIAFEGKSGYGLDTKSEIKQLKVLQKLEERCSQKIVKTFLGPHALAPEFPDYSSFMDYIIENMLDEIKGEVDDIVFADVFCEEGVFTVEQSEKYIKAALEKGFKIKMHADELKDIGGSRLAVKYNAQSADHLIQISDEAIGAIASSNTVATLLPGTSFFLGKSFAPARKLIDSGAAVALASDFNPGSCTINDPSLIAHLASSKLKMSPEEIITAMTLNAACAIGIEEEYGTLEVGKKAGIILWDIPDYKFLPYFPAHNMVNTVISPKKVLKLKDSEQK